jgi:hypothetical protein
MKKILTVVGIAAALTLSGCSMIPGSEAKPSESQSAEAKETAPVTAEAIPTESVSLAPSEEASTDPAPDGIYYSTDFEVGAVSDTDFIALVREKAPALSAVGDGALLVIPGKACASLANGETFIELLKGTAESLEVSIESETGAPAVYTPEVGQAAGLAVALGVRNYCPQYEETLKAQVPHTNQ